MQRNRKTLSALVIGVLFIFLVKSSFAQYPGMAAVRAQQNTQFMNQQMNTMFRLMNMRGVTGSAEEYDFQITMLDSTKKDIVSAIYTDPRNKKKFVMYEDKNYKKSDTNRYKKIYPSQTLSIAQIYAEQNGTYSENAPVKYFYGTPADSCWMFNIKAGVISRYSYLCDGWDARYSPETIVGIQLNGEPIVKFTAENLRKIIEQDAEAMKYFDKKKYFKAIDKYNSDIEKAPKK